MNTWSSSSQSWIPGLRKSAVSPLTKAGHFNWASVPVKHKVGKYIPLPSGKPLKLPKIQFEFKEEDPKDKALREERLGEVKKAFSRCYSAYKKHAWLQDELAPVSGTAKNPFGGWAATLVDSLDTLWILDMKDEFHEAVTAVAGIDFSKSSLESINVFETTIRYLGGFIAAYDLSGDRRLLDKALEVGEMLYVAFDTVNRMPITRWNPNSAFSDTPAYASESVLSAEIGSLTLEFTRLSQITKDSKFFDAVQRVSNAFAGQQNTTALPGMFPMVVNGRTLEFGGPGTYTLGAMADSLYEYFPKAYALLGGLEPVYKDLYEQAMDTAIKHNFFRPLTPNNADILISGNVEVGGRNAQPTLKAEGQHLVCFAGGMLALGGRLFQNTTHVELGEKLTRGCVWAYKACPLSIMPETFELLPCADANDCVWNETRWKEAVLRKHSTETTFNLATANKIISEKKLPMGFLTIPDPRYILRPEAIESVFLLYRITGAPDLQHVAWRMFNLINRYTVTDLANSAIENVLVHDNKPKRSDSMESFWMAETLKYFALVFGGTGVLGLDEWVFNTEAHPFRRPR
ncbi:glycoside hydrolase family 47 protein [Aulographum hederae CBS 113979]|uniref:alpha-1,2-Mannosidase n=1 Tax=Aulographum hederae CBS 113979 TaxID=1176131 RepID=A0A6G1GSJ3_9PEZI|nr:glycoside hydrolase family 47 protein [Aulographum hederae CBS 113979]